MNWEVPFCSFIISPFILNPLSSLIKDWFTYFGGFATCLRTFSALTQSAYFFNLLTVHIIT